jgi:hypothetical protein
MKMRALLLTSIALVSLMLLIQVTGAGGHDSGSASQVLAAPDSGARDLSLKPCGEPFAQFHLGQSFQGHRLSAHTRICTKPEPERTLAAGGAIDPDSVGRSNFESYVYGTCDPRPDQGCAPPLEIQSWPACERSPADYTAGPPGGAEPIQPTQTFQLRGVPARVYDDGSLELSTAAVTVVIFGQTTDQLIAAAAALRTPSSSPLQAARDQILPAPVPGAQNGTLSC